MDKVVGGPRDTSLDALLDLDGQVLVIDERGGYWVKFEVRLVAATKERPHGLDYSMTLHGNDNERLVGFDNAHAVRQSAGPGGKAKAATITSIECAQSVRMSTGMRRLCWQIFGRK
jgi:hypothetical protein